MEAIVYFAHLQSPHVYGLVNRMNTTTEPIVQTAHHAQQRQQDGTVVCAVKTAVFAMTMSVLTVPISVLLLPAILVLKELLLQIVYVMQIDITI